MDLLHLITQDYQSYGSIRKCCEKCGLSIYAFKLSDFYVDDKSEYTQEVANERNMSLCTDHLVERF